MIEAEHQVKRAVLADIEANFDFYNPVSDRYILSYMGDHPDREVYECAVPMDYFRTAIDALRAKGVDYEDGAIAPYELVTGEAAPLITPMLSVPHSKTVWSAGESRAKLDVLVAEISCGGWVKVGSDLDAFVGECEQAIESAFEEALCSWEREVERRPGSRTLRWNLVAGGGCADPVSVATAAAMFCDQLRDDPSINDGGIPSPDELDGLFAGWIDEHERDGVLAEVGAPSCRYERACASAQVSIVVDAKACKSANPKPTRS